MQIVRDKYGRLWTCEFHLARVRPETCPKCQSARIDTIDYSANTEPTDDHIARGAPGSKSPAWQCRDCRLRIWWDSTGPNDTWSLDSLHKSCTPERSAQRRARDGGNLPKPYAKRKPRKCPDCGGTRIRRVDEGWLLPEPNIKRTKDGWRVIGGCLAGFDDPTWECIDCGEQIWREPDTRRKSSARETEDRNETR